MMIVGMGLIENGLALAGGASAVGVQGRESGDGASGFLDERVEGGDGQVDESEVVRLEMEVS